MKRPFQAVAALLLIPALAFAGLLTQTATKSYVATTSDTTPSPFLFPDQSSVALSSTITSASVTITSIDTSITCSATGGTIDKNGDGNFQSSQSIANGDTIRARHTSSASNSTATNTVVDCNGVSDTFTSTTLSGGASGVFFEPDVDNAANVAAIFTHDRNCYGTGGVETWGSVTLISDTSRPGHTKSVRITYPAGTDEAGCELKPPAFAETASLFVRTYVKFSSGWSGNWPLALKTARFFSRADWSIGTEGDGWAYISEKLAANQFGMGADADEVAHGYNNAIYNLDLWAPYPAVNFGNGLPYIRTDHWYKWERWYVMNSAVDAEDGIMQIWIDDELVVDRQNVTYRSTQHHATDNPENGTGWQSMWFGGNYTGSSFGATGPELHRDEQGYYLSTTLDR